MNKHLEDAVDAVRRLPPQRQEEIAAAIRALAGEPEAVVLSPEENAALAESEAQADRGEFADEAQVRAVWSKYGL